MAKKSKKKIAEKIIEEKKDDVLPQNFVAMGEPALDAKKIYISQQTYNDIHAFTIDKTENESGGFLIGHVLEEFGKLNIIIIGFVEAKNTEATISTLKFTHKTWELANAEIESKYPNMKIVGWIHTHPNFGIFLSEYDLFIQKNTFNSDFQVAYVVDPIQNLEGFYYWDNGEIAKGKGFYIFDETGIEITLYDETPSIPEKSQRKSSLILPIISGILIVAVVVLLINTLFLRDQVTALERDLSDEQNLSAAYQTESVQNFQLWTQEINNLKLYLDELQQQVEQLEKATPQYLYPPYPNRTQDDANVESDSPGTENSVNTNETETNASVNNVPPKEGHE
jgi:proteasome lid subunit RPN8/RPN11